MQKKYNFLFFIIQFVFYPSLALDNQERFKFSDRAQWQEACAQLPLNIDVTHENIFQSGFSYNSEIKEQKSRGWQEFDIALHANLLLLSKQLSDSSAWPIDKKPENDFYSPENNKFLPYAQKVDMQPEQKIVFHGDFHGDIHSFHAELDQLEQQKILKPGSFELLDKKVHLAFLGDYVDRGNYGAEVMYTLLRLKLANPDNVLIVRGNHEDKKISDRYGFADELKAKFGPDTTKYNKIYRLYDLLPVVAYVGHEQDYIQCCHGGLEYGYKPSKLLESSHKFELIGQLQRGKFKDFLDRNKDHNRACCHSKHTDEHPKWDNHAQAFLNYTPSAPIDNQGSLGFMWADFAKFGPALYAKGRGLIANEDLTKAVLDFQNEDALKKVRGVFRAHQHTGSADQNNHVNLMYELIKSNGVYSMWRPIETRVDRSLKDGLVWTFNTGPDNKAVNQKLKYGFDAFAILVVAKKYEDWKLSVHNPIVINRSDFSKPKTA